MQRWCAFSSPQVHSHPRTLSVSVSPSLLPPPLALSPSLSLLSSSTLHFFLHLPQVHQMIPLTWRSFTSLLPISCTYNFQFWLYFKRFLMQVLLSLRSFMWTCVRRMEPAAPTESRYTETAKKKKKHTAVKHLLNPQTQRTYAHVCKANQQPLQQHTLALSLLQLLCI